MPPELSGGDAGAGADRGRFTAADMAGCCASAAAVALVVGLWLGFGAADRRTPPWRASGTLREELAPAFRAYLAGGDADRRRGRLPVPGGGWVPVEELAVRHGADYFVIPLDRVARPRPGRWWAAGNNWRILDYEPGHALAILDPLYAGRLIDDAPPAPPDGGRATADAAWEAHFATVRAEFDRRRRRTESPAE